MKPEYSPDEGQPIVGEVADAAALSVNLFNVLDRDLHLPPEASAAAPAAAPAPAQGVTLSDCLAKFSETEQLSEEDQVYCKSCKTFRRSYKTVKCWNAPRVLIVHLKRFGRDRLTGPLEKITTHVDCPIEYELETLTGRCSYRLTSVVYHSGEMAFGHYTATCWDENTQKWWHFNDSHVSETTEAEVVTKYAYILVYSRLEDLQSSG
jgi:ubiquitin carboxyl-terminal hydrolase 4/11/15